MSELLTTRYMYRSPFALEGVGIELPDASTDPGLNRMPFRGVLTRVDEASTRPPNGSQGHRVFIPRQVAEEALPSLIGMPVNFADELNDHDKKQPVGIVTEAHIEGKDLVVSGHLFSKNFPEETQEIQRRKHELGQSYEISDVLVEDTEAPIWKLNGLKFTGAAILRKDSAAYANTSIMAQGHEEDDMPATKAEQVLDELKKLRSDLMAAKDEDEDAKRHDDEDAKRRADAKKHDDEDAKRRDEEDARKKDEDEDAKRHDDEDAKKHDDGDDDDQEARRRDDDEDARYDDDEDAMADVMAMMLKTMRRGRGRKQDARRRDEDARRHDDEDAKRHDDEDAKRHDDEDARTARLFASFMKAMAYPGVAPRARRKHDAAHDDEAEDMMLINKLLKQGKLHASRSTVDLAARRLEKKIDQAVEAVGLLTDIVKRDRGLATDRTATNRGLATEQNRGNNGGPARRTMAGAGEHWVTKFEPDQDASAAYQEADKQFAQLTWLEKDAQRASSIAKKLEIQQRQRQAQ